MCNGTDIVKLKTIHGQFDFRLQKYLFKGKSCNYFDLTSQLTTGNISHGLQELVAYYSNRISYQEVEKLLLRISGSKLLSDQKIWKIVVNKAVEVSSKWQQEIQSNKQSIKSEPSIASLVDIYNPLSPEILLFDDGIGVKKQKENRHKKQDIVISKADKSGQKQKRKTVITDVVLLQKPKGGFEYLISPIDNKGKPLISLEEIIKCQLKSYYSDCNFPLPIVAITDGASSIRKRLHSLNPRGITLILDWYHLCKKLREFLSMITRNKAEKTEHSKFLFYHLWHGNLRFGHFFRS